MDRPSIFINFAVGEDTTTMNKYSNDFVSAENEMILYQPDSSISLNVRVEDETVWLTQSQMTELFHTTRNNVTIHIRNIFKEGELEKSSVCKESLLTAADGKQYKTRFYSLDVIISVGYRVKNLPFGTNMILWNKSCSRAIPPESPIKPSKFRWF